MLPYIQVMKNSPKHFPKKSLGQNFLRSAGALRKIIEAGKLTTNDVVLEIGPGQGALTRELLSSPVKKVIAIEKDDNLYEELKLTFSKELGEGRLELIHGDALEFDIQGFKKILDSRILSTKFEINHENDKDEDINLLDQSHYKILANIPYNITGAFIRKYLEAEIQPEIMVILIQKEVAERIISRDGKESILSISVKAYGTPRIEGKVPRGSFHPVPNVDSAILAINNISRTFFQNIDEKKFFETLKYGFAHKRKKLSSNLKAFDENITLPDGWENKRAEEVKPEEWKTLVELNQKKTA
jgi:16S rRNA (adenine1518-N6/adenine1519-N6)-dimethyltransferase